jgi:hypothetical protein
VGVRVPNTISDKEFAKIQERARKSAPPMFSNEAVKKRLATGKQKDKADQS